MRSYISTAPARADRGSMCTNLNIRSPKHLANASNKGKVRISPETVVAGGGGPYHSGGGGPEPWTLAHICIY